MKSKRFCQLFLAAALVVLIASLVSADDGVMFRRNVSRTPDHETEDAAISMMKFYVPAQHSDGTVEPIEYYDDLGGLVETREYAKPLFISYIDGIEVPETGNAPLPLSGIGFGHRDTFVAHSLDDGATWKDANLSKSADLSSFNLADGTAYPGDVFAAVHTTSGSKVMAAWVSRYCDGGKPAYTLLDEEGEYLYPDYYGVAGGQGSVDYTLQGYPEVGEIPYGCVWTARGELVEMEDENGNLVYDVLWRHAERLTSGRRDANKIEIAAASEAGIIITWQEDPEGLRPGQGLGPGAGWSGAIVNAQTDVWYSYIGWDDFRLVLDEEGNAIPPEEYLGEEKPWPGVPMAVPVRLTDNAMCKYDAVTFTLEDEIPDDLIDDPYCYLDLNENGDSDLCAREVSWTNPGNTTLSVCETEIPEDVTGFEYGRVLWGRVGASRARIGMAPYDTGVDDEDGNPIMSAWVVMAYEENKALGDVLDPITGEPIDIGKDLYYHSFDMFNPDLVSRGHMLNQPAVDPAEDDFFPLIESEEDFIDDQYESEIARRFSLIMQTPEKALETEEGLVLFALFKQGIINQGGPADIMARRFVLPEDWVETENPYAFENMICDDGDAGTEDWAYNTSLGQEYNPNYPGGVCLVPAINVSGTTMLQCDGGDCLEVTEWPGLEEPPTPIPRVEVWEQTAPGEADDPLGNLDDQSWENPYDVAKGHRGFLDGDFLMLMYAWSPNWKANSVGHDKYNLYVRRSFDGGMTWTTWPEGDGIAEEDGHCENYLDDTQECAVLAPGEFEQAWNVSQLTSTRITVLDPRYNPTPGSICQDEECTSFLYPDDERDPSKFFVVYETGDNTTVDVGEATPLDLFYSRATEWGDKYFTVEKIDPSNGDTIDVWDWLENQQDDLSGEASILSNPGGNFFYATWNQWQEFEEEVIENSDAWFRRVWFNDDDDLGPVVTGLWFTPNAADIDSNIEVRFVGTARDRDQMGHGIVGYRWHSSLDGPLSAEQSFSVPVNSLSLGVHAINFSGRDNEGNWAPDRMIYFLVAEELHQIYLPLGQTD